MTQDNTQIYILTEEGRAYSRDGIDFVLGMVRETFNDDADVTINEGMLYNQPAVLAECLGKQPDRAYVFVSHADGIEVMRDVDDVNRFVGLLNDPDNADETSWSIIMKALELL